MTIETKISIGDTVFLFGDPKWKTVCTAIIVRASGQIEYLLEWGNGDGLREEWITAERQECLSKIFSPETQQGFQQGLNL